MHSERAQGTGSRYAAVQKLCGIALLKTTLLVLMCPKMSLCLYFDIEKNVREEILFLQMENSLPLLQIFWAGFYGKLN